MIEAHTGPAGPRWSRLWLKRAAEDFDIALRLYKRSTARRGGGDPLGRRARHHQGELVHRGTVRSA
jgi:hypothetical protein